MKYVVIGTLGFCWMYFKEICVILLLIYMFSGDV